MGRTKVRSKQKKALLASSAPTEAPTSTSSSQPQLFPLPILITKAQNLINTCDYDLAEKFLIRALEGLKAERDLLSSTATSSSSKGGNGNHGMVDVEEERKLVDEKEAGVLQLLGEVILEIGDREEEARQHFLNSISLISNLPLPIRHRLSSSSSCHLYLAQLSTSPEEALSNFQSALDILKASLVNNDSSTVIKETTMDEGEKLEPEEEEEEEEEEKEKRRKASRCLVGMTELYLTDLCFDPSAESNCETFLTEAIKLDDEDPEVYQTFASVRLSQQRDMEAKELLMKGWSLWRGMDPTTNPPPPSPSRLSLCRLLIELSLYSSALEILSGLEMEDDEDPEVAYLEGWVWGLLAETKKKSEEGSKYGNGNGNGEELNGVKEEDDGESWEECLMESRGALENCVKLSSQSPDRLEPDILSHAQELLKELISTGVDLPKPDEPAPDGERGEDWEDLNDDDDNQGGEDVEMG